MRLLAWLIKLAFFLLVLWFALKNTTPVTLHFTSSLSWQNIPLILIMVACLAVGALLGALALALPIYRIRRELVHLKRQVVAPGAPSTEETVATAARRSGAVGGLDAAPDVR